MVSIELHNLRLHAFHGLYEGESKTGSAYELNLKASYNEESAQFNDINNTINYVDVFDIVKRCMAIPTPLLEKVAEGIIRRIKHQYPFVVEVVISIYKLEPPIENIQGKIGITMKKEWER